MVDLGPVNQSLSSWGSFRVIQGHVRGPRLLGLPVSTSPQLHPSSGFLGDLTVVGTPLRQLAYDGPLLLSPLATPQLFPLWL